MSILSHSQWTHWVVPAAAIYCSGGTTYAAQYLSIEKAQKVCFPNTQEFIAAPVLWTGDQKTRIESLSGLKILTKGQQVWRAQTGGKLIGYFILDYVVGKHLLIDYAVALDPGGKVIQVEILEYRESYGGEIRSENWRNQFKGKTAQSPLLLNQDIMNISGATLSSRHVTEGVKRILAFYETCLR